MQGDQIQQPWRVRGGGETTYGGGLSTVCIKSMGHFNMWSCALHKRGVEYGVDDYHLHLQEIAILGISHLAKGNFDANPIYSKTSVK